MQLNSYLRFRSEPEGPRHSVRSWSSLFSVPQISKFLEVTSS